MIPSIHDNLAFLLVRDQRNIAQRNIAQRNIAQRNIARLVLAERNNSAAPTLAKQFRQEDSR
jgi:hypothetical protein